VSLVAVLNHNAEDFSTLIRHRFHHFERSVFQQNFTRNQAFNSA
jgi:hypothetical protein